MERTIKNWWLVLIKGIILIILGIYIFRHPVQGLIGLALYLGIGLLATGFFLILAAMTFRRVYGGWDWRLAEGIIDIVFALILLSNPAITAAVFPFIVGLWIMMYGIIFIAGSFKVKKRGDSNWWVGLLGGIIGVMIGFFVTRNPMAGVFAITYWMGLGFVILGLINIMASFSLRKIRKVMAEEG